MDLLPTIKYGPTMAFRAMMKVELAKKKEKFWKSYTLR